MPAQEGIFNVSAILNTGFTGACYSLFKIYFPCNTADVYALDFCYTLIYIHIIIIDQSKTFFMKTRFAVLVFLSALILQLQVKASNGPLAVNEKLLKAFQAAFPQAEKVDWIENGDHYFVHFKDHEIISEIEYDHEGNFLASERYYKAADMLPIHLAWALHKKFPNKAVFGITETNTEAETIYYIKLEDNKEWITVKGSSDGITQVIEKFNKQL
jgi:hypothetical protein